MTNCGPRRAPYIKSKRLSHNVPRTYKTLSLSLPPEAVEKLSAIGAPTRRTAARVAAELVLADLSRVKPSKDHLINRQLTGCCLSRVRVVCGQFLLPETVDGVRAWQPLVALFCGLCQRQLHGHEYEGWIP